MSSTKVDAVRGILVEPNGGLLSQLTEDLIAELIREVPMSSESIALSLSLDLPQVERILESRPDLFVKVAAHWRAVTEYHFDEYERMNEPLPPLEDEA